MYRSASAAICRATSIEPFVPRAPSEYTISAPKAVSSSVRSALTLSGITTFRR
jgi:hypothetical protein